jgi:DNA-binding NtrC family response regulator
MMRQRIDVVTVLAVDDVREQLRLYEAWLSEDCDLRTATGGEEALAELDADVDVVLLDRNMPDLPGEVVLAEIRERGIGCRVAMVSGVEPDFDIVKMGFDDYLVKPIGGDQLRDTVDRLVKRSTYDEQIQRLFSLCAKRAVLEAEKPDDELAESDEYASLTAEIGRLRTETHTAVEAFDPVDFEAAFRDLAADGD